MRRSIRCASLERCAALRFLGVCNAPPLLLFRFSIALTRKSRAHSAFVVFLFSQIWKVQVHAMLRQDIHASLGSTSTSLLPMQGDSFDRTAACFSSSPLEVFFSDCESASSSASSRGAAVRLEPRISNQLRFTFRPASVGNTQHIIHVVDVDERKLLFAWIVHAHCSAPSVGKTFNVAVPARRAVAKVRRALSCFKCMKAARCGGTAFLLLLLLLRRHRNVCSPIPPLPPGSGAHIAAHLVYQ